MSDLRQFLDELQLQEEVVKFRGRDFLVVEIDLAERGRLFADHTRNGSLSNRVAEGLLMSRCILDPETRQQVVATEDYKTWQSKGCSVAKLLRTVLRLNGLADDDPVDVEVKD